MSGAAGGPGRPLKIGMVGGGRGAFIGAVHRMAAALDGRWATVAGALSSTPEKAMASAREIGLAPDRSYGSWREMLEREAARPVGERIDAVAVVTPNATHFEVAAAFAERGFHVVLDKPMVTTCGEAERLRGIVQRAGVVCAVTYNYTGYPMVRRAREIIRAGELGTIRKVFVEYHQGWLATKLEESGQKQAAWRVDPTMAGAGGAIGDIGTHAENLAHFVAGLAIESLCADVSTFAPGRKLDDDAGVLLRFAGGARGVLTASQVCIGERNALTLRVHGETGSLAWRQESPEELAWHKADGSTELLARAGPGLSGGAAMASRLPPGHPEGFIEAFANIYRGVADAIEARRSGGAPGGMAAAVPTVEDGARGVRFIERVVESGRSGGWVAF